MSEPSDILFANIIRARRLLGNAEIDAALARLAERRRRGQTGTLVEILLREGQLSPDAALSVRADYDRQIRAEKKSASASASAAIPASVAAAASAALPDELPDATRLNTRAAPTSASPPSADVVASNANAVAVTAGSSRSDSPSSLALGSHALTNFSPSAIADPLIGKNIGGCEVIDKLGEGGMGTVYRARHLGLDKFVAVKILATSMIDDAVRIERFKREAKSAAQIEHPNIVQILNVGEQDGVHYIIMQYIHGEDLRKRLTRTGPLPIAEVFDVAVQVGKGLKVAHEKGIVHRDIKPDNIMFDEQDRIKITDFGLAKSVETDVTTTRPGRAVGTPYYMSPEQCAGKEVDARSDIYSLGATLYHVATGRRPFKGDTPVQTALMHLKQPPQPPIELRPDLPRSLNGLILRMLAKSPDDRFQTCDELLIALEVAETRIYTRPKSVVELMAGTVAVAPTTAGTSSNSSNVKAAQDQTEPALPAAKVSTDEQDETSLANVSQPAPTPSGDTRAVTTPPNQPQGPVSPMPEGGLYAADDESAPPMPRLALAVGVGLLGLGMVLVIWAIVAVATRETTPAPAGNSLASNPPSGRNGNGGTPPHQPRHNRAPIGAPTGQQIRNEQAAVEFERIRGFVAPLVAEQMYDHAIESVEKFLAIHAGTTSEPAAHALRNDLRERCRKMCEAELRDLIALASEQVPREGYTKALETLAAPRLQRYIEQQNFDALERMLDRARNDIRGQAERAAETVLNRARLALQADPPRLLEARDLLVERSATIDLLDLKNRLAGEIESIDKLLETARLERGKAVIEMLQLEHRVLGELVALLPEFEKLTQSPEQIERAKHRLQTEWLQIPARGAAHPTVLRMMRDFDTLQAFFTAADEALRSARRRNEPVRLARTGESVVRWRLVELRPGTGFVGTPETAPEEWGTRQPIAYADLSAASLAAFVRDFVESANPVAVPMFLLSRHAHPELQAHLQTTPAMAERFSPAAQASFFAIYTAVVTGSEALQMASIANATPGQLAPAAATAQRALAVDPQCGSACLAAGLIEMHHNRFAAARDKLRPAVAGNRDRPFFAVMWATAELRAGSPDQANTVANAVLAHWMGRDPHTAFDRYVVSRAYFLRGLARIRQAPAGADFSLELVDLDEALRLDPAADDVYRSIKELRQRR